jgi:hypothetical protein
MPKYLDIRAGHKAYDIITSEGLDQRRVTAMEGAAGAAKWLVLSEIDKYLFGTFFKKRKDPLFLIGSSIGSWRFTAAAQKKPCDAIEIFKEEYIRQSYRGYPTAAEVTAESWRIMDAYASGNAVKEILTHPFMRLQILSARSRLLTQSEIRPLQYSGLGAAFALNLISRRLMNLAFERTVFSDPRDIAPFADQKDFATRRIALTEKNFRKAVMASGSIPVVMSPVTDIDGTDGGLYRDGGMIDYHPALRFKEMDALVLYPHFSNRLVPGWFDKYLKNRRHADANLSNVVMIAPSQAFLDRLPYGKIPDRDDFKKFLGNDQERKRYWNKAVKECAKMADELRELIESGKIRNAVQRF